jgi:hypothetical protein
MNIKDKLSVFQEVFRVLKPGCVFGIYDVMRHGEGSIAFPVPWAADESMSFVETPEQYKRLLQDAGFAVESCENRHEFAVEFFNSMQLRVKEQGLSPLGIHVVMGNNALEKIKNLRDNLSNGLIAPFELIVRKPV